MAIIISTNLLNSLLRGVVMSNVRSVLSVVMLCSIVSGSVFLKGMEELNSGVGGKNNSREVKKIECKLNKHLLPFYLNISENPVFMNRSKKSLSKRYGYKIFDNDLFMSFYVLPDKDGSHITLHGKEGNRRDLAYCQFGFGELMGIDIPVKMLVNGNGTFKGKGDVVEVKMIEENFDIELMITNKVKEFYNRIKKSKISPHYIFFDNGDEKALFDKEILVEDINGKDQHGPNGFDFSMIRTLEQIRQLDNIILFLTNIKDS